MEILDAAAEGSYEVQRTILETLYSVSLMGTPLHACMSKLKDDAPLQRCIAMLPPDTLSLLPYVCQVNSGYIQTLQRAIAPLSDDVASRVSVARDPTTRQWTATIADGASAANRLRVLGLVQAVEKSSSDTRALSHDDVETPKDYEKLMVLLQASAHRTGRAVEQARQLHRAAVHMALLTGDVTASSQDMLSGGDVALLAIMRLRGVDLTDAEQRQVANIFASMQCTGDVRADIKSLYAAVYREMGGRVAKALERVGLGP